MKGRNWAVVSFFFRSDSFTNSSSNVSLRKAIIPSMRCIKVVQSREGGRNHLRKHGGREERECESGSDAVFRGRLTSPRGSRVSISHRHCLASSFRMVVTRVPKETTRQEDYHLVHQALSFRHRKRDSLKRDTFNYVVVPSSLGGRKRRFPCFHAS